MAAFPKKVKVLLVRKIRVTVRDEALKCEG